MTESLNFENTCRLCLNSNSIVNLSVKPKKININYYFLLNSCTSIKAEMNDSLPTKMCKKCEKLLVKYYKFRNSVIENDEKLRAIVNSRENNVSQDIPVKTEEILDIKVENTLENEEQDQEFANLVEQDKYISDDDIPLVDIKVECVLDTPAEKQKKVKKTYQCKVCRKTCKNSVKLTDHESTHSEEKAFGCDLCEKKFKRKDTLMDHKKRHNGERKFECDVCKKTFLRQSYLKEHARIHTGEKPYMCSSCGKAFSNSSGLMKHRKTHSEETPFKCEVCQKRFKQQKNLRDHVQSMHTGLRPYLCNVCGKSFAHRQYYIVHKKIHLGIYAYPCEICGQRTICKSDLKKHMRTHNVANFEKC